MKKLLVFLTLAIIASTSFAGVYYGPGHFNAAAFDEGSDGIFVKSFTTGSQYGYDRYNYELTAECNNIDAVSEVRIVVPGTNTYLKDLYTGNDVVVTNMGGEQTISGSLLVVGTVSLEIELDIRNGDTGTIYGWIDLFPNSLF